MKFHSILLKNNDCEINILNVRTSFFIQEQKIYFRQQLSNQFINTYIEYHI